MSSISHLIRDTYPPGPMSNLKTWSCKHHGEEEYISVRSEELLFRYSIIQAASDQSAHTIVWLCKFSESRDHGLQDHTVLMKDSYVAELPLLTLCTFVYGFVASKHYRTWTYIHQL